MKKVQYTQFGDENVLELTDQPVPAIKPGQLLIRINAVSINPLDWKIYGGDMKLMSGRSFPKAAGIDFSGTVVQTGSQVTQYQVGDAVLGLLDVFKGGALAEYVVVSEAEIAPKPANISFEEAAALPVAGLSAVQIVDELAVIRAGQDVLINGASGGIGLLAVQLAKQRGARVTAVASTKGVAEAERWGADRVVDYTKQDSQSLMGQFDAVVDLANKLSFAGAKRLMKPRSVFVSTLPSPLGLLGSFINNIVSGRKHRILVMKATPEKLQAVARLAEQGLHIVLAERYPLAHVRDAYREARAGQLIGKSVIQLA